MTGLVFSLVLAAAVPRPSPDPTLPQLRDAALRRASLDAVAARRWLQRARAAAVLPTVTFEVGRDLQRGWSLQQEPGSPDRLDADADGSLDLGIRVGWQLDRLIFNPDELRAARMALDVLDHRAAVLTRVTELWAERRRLLAEEAALTAPAPAEALLDLRQRRWVAEGLLEAISGLSFPPEGSVAR